MKQKLKLVPRSTIVRFKNLYEAEPRVDFEETSSWFPLSLFKEDAGFWDIDGKTAKL